MEITCITCLQCKKAKLEKIEKYLYTNAIDNVYEYYNLYQCPKCLALWEESQNRPGALFKFPKFIK